jgi:dihydrodipicolinate reductase
MIKVIICGAGGRMGRENIAVFNNDCDISIIGAIEDKQSKLLGH